MASQWPVPIFGVAAGGKTSVEGLLALDDGFPDFMMKMMPDPIDAGLLGSDFDEDDDDDDDDGDNEPAEKEKRARKRSRGGVLRNASEDQKMEKRCVWCTFCSQNILSLGKEILTGLFNLPPP
jgi:hypothetical protein